MEVIDAILPSHGDIVILNGTSSAGKTSIAGQMQDLSDELLLHSGIDHFLHNMPRRIFDEPTWCAVQSDAGGRLCSVTLGPAARAFLKTVYRAIAEFATAGISVIIDDVMHDAEIAAYAVRTLAPFDPLLVGIRCRLDIANERERRRGDRALGSASTFFEIAHFFTEYDVEVDTSDIDARTAAAAILTARDGPRTAIRRLHERLQTTFPN